MRISVAGRTDKGVHARGQVISFDAPAGRLDVRRLQRSIAALSGGAIALRSAEVVGDDFDARFSAQWRHYRYRVGTAAAADPLDRLTIWHLGATLDVAEMNEAAQVLVGTHDFASFCRAPKPVSAAATPASTIRRVLEATWTEVGPDERCFEIRATAFCHQMVRSIVGLCVDVGRGRIEASEVRSILESRDRGGVRTVAPPHGLTLWEVGYES